MNIYEQKGYNDCIWPTSAINFSVEHLYTSATPKHVYISTTTAPSLSNACDCGEWHRIKNISH